VQTTQDFKQAAQELNRDNISAICSETVEYAKQANTVFDELAKRTPVIERAGSPVFGSSSKDMRVQDATYAIKVLQAQLNVTLVKLAMK
jgi:hypothetical protein